MVREKLPTRYEHIKKQNRKFFYAVERLGKISREEGPLNEKMSHLIQLAAAAAIRSEGAVHSHTRRALASGAKPEEIRHAIRILASTIGFPTVAAALSWVEDVID
jgi:4-carboxymuconolactone decarboxylase